MRKVTVKEDEVKKDIAEIKIALEIMKKQIEKLEERILPNKQYEKDSREIFEMRNNK